MSARNGTAVWLHWGAVGVIVVALSGCTFITPQSTKGMLETSVGRNLRIGEVAVGNIVLVSNDGVEANTVATLINLGDVPRTLAVSTKEAEAPGFTILLPPDTFVQLGRQPDAIAVIAIDTEPGSLLDLTFRDDRGHVLTAGVPVVTDDLPSSRICLPRTLCRLSSES